MRRWIAVFWVVLAISWASGGAAAQGVAASPAPPSEAVGRIAEASGGVEVFREGEWFAAEAGDEVAADDQVRTFEDGLARIEFYDGDEAAGAEATVVDLSPHSTVHIAALEFGQAGESAYRHGLLDVLRGAINAITKGWGQGSLFSVRAGTTVCGIRGSIANVAYDPETAEETVTSLDGEMYTYEAETRDEAIAKTREAGRHLRQRGRVPFFRRLGVGNKMWRAGRRERRFARLEEAVLKRARAAAHSSRRQGLRGSRRWLGAFSRVRPPKAKWARSGRRLRERFGALRAPAGWRRRFAPERWRGGDRTGPAPAGNPKNWRKLGERMREKLPRPKRPRAPRRKLFKKGALKKQLKKFGPKKKPFPDR